ncbi:hypothetical protein H0486_00805 [Lachnospiraceae bacterium MD1]|uniref:4Fe-4S ferredoxin-type domain-containing protein n=1 Tax=Variimorphobacter saccharofermentans TaxID=2755051 RepID=A0A839JUS9_9FIRM|nr:EFR1 family ferrodoxin [Variimorphobacter saccharofermentans]MBB2181435.1 hypothetical protein [Variimorphobacter saccharofermentans]
MVSRIIFYFTGTGNSYAVANKVAKELGETELVPITRIKDFPIEKYSMVGIVYPVYYIHAPEIVIRMLDHIHFYSSQQIFIIATHAASWGYALSDVKSLPAFSDCRHVQEFRVKMPGNNILEYGAFPQFYQKNILRKADRKINEIVTTIINKESTKSITPNLLARLFKQNGEGKTQVFHDLGEKFYVTSNCQHCGVCEKICPAKNIELSNGSVIWGNQCQCCMACIQWCPQNAIAHPALNHKRTRYTHPDITQKQLWRI